MGEQPSPPKGIGDRLVLLISHVALVWGEQPSPPKGTSEVPDVVRRGAVGTSEGVLDTSQPRAYDQPLYAQKCSARFEHVFERYPGRDVGVYRGA